MEIKNKTTITDEIVKKASAARENEDNKYKVFKKIYFAFGILFAAMFIWELVMIIIKSSNADSLMMVVYLAASAVLLYIGRSGLEYTAYRNFRKKYANMIDVTFETVLDNSGIKVTDQDGDDEVFTWDYINTVFMDKDNVYVDVRDMNRIILSRAGFKDGDDVQFVNEIKARIKARGEEGIVEDTDV